MVIMFVTLIFRSHDPNVHQSGRKPGLKFLQCCIRKLCDRKRSFTLTDINIICRATNDIFSYAAALAGATSGLITQPLLLQSQRIHFANH